MAGRIDWFWFSVSAQVLVRPLALKDAVGAEAASSKGEMAEAVMEKVGSSLGGPGWGLAEAGRKNGDAPCSWLPFLLSP